MLFGRERRRFFGFGSDLLSLHKPRLCRCFVMVGTILRQISFFLFGGRRMVEISGHGIITIDGRSVPNDAVFYWLDICEKPGELVAEGSIHGSEELLRQVKKAKRAMLEPEAGPPLFLTCEGGRNGVRWVKALRA
jgi:hypothetical protein